MDAAARRAAILRRLESADRPLSASLLGEEMGVSRQVVPWPPAWPRRAISFREHASKGEIPGVTKASW